ncbi:golgin subfamily A member 6-like protein 25 [Clytia hemisphaerica]|uniref:Uncharacterized protein n=1 Tax=Clytia hemisphaerica TaxID=252671 RepID=A0A7M5V9J4_9CNID
MDSAHCATDPLRLKPNQNDDQIQKLKAEMTKMKEDYERKIQVLNYEHQIKVLEFEKTLSEKNNIIQTMKHQREIEKLKMEQKEFEVKSKMAYNGDESEVQSKLKTLEREVQRLQNEVARFQEFDNKTTLNDAKLAMIDAKVVEINNQSVEKDNKIIQLKTKIDDELAAMKTDIIQKVEAKLEKDDLVAIQRKMVEVEEKMQETDGDIVKRLIELEEQSQKSLWELEAKVKEMGTSIDELPEMESLVWGARKFMEGLVVKKFNPAPTYKKWYEHISSFMTNGKLYYDNAKYFFCRKEMDGRFDRIGFASERKKCMWAKHTIVVDKFHGDLRDKGKVWLLHPTDQSKKLELPKGGTHTNYDSWYNVNVDDHFYYGDKNSVVIFGIK